MNKEEILRTAKKIYFKNSYYLESTNPCTAWRMAVKLSYMVYLTLSDKKKGKIGAKPDTFERAVRWYTTTGSKFWPKNQTLVSETSY